MAHGYSQIYGYGIIAINKKKMNTLIVAGSILLIAIGGTLFFKYQDRKMAKE